ncbi:MAG TPA: DUF4168 domain-containing protein [Rhodospirillales bacterium]|jgi:patatin-like phospholipase/acyl hydrolase|nr:DUF4168 domain-containing protein [Rhodospirillales bacterium]
MGRTLATTLKALCLALLLGATLSGAALAQAAPTNFSDAKLNSFIEAAKKIDGVIVAWNPKIAAAKTPEEKQEVLTQAEGEALKAIEKTKGITVDEYRQIGEAARQNPDLAAKLDKLYQAKP